MIFCNLLFESESSPNRRHDIPILTLNQSELVPNDVMLFGIVQSESVSINVKRRFFIPIQVSILTNQRRARLVETENLVPNDVSALGLIVPS